MKPKISFCLLAISFGLIGCSETATEEITTNKLQKESAMCSNMKKSSISFTFRLGEFPKIVGDLEFVNCLP